MLRILAGLRGVGHFEAYAMWKLSVVFVLATLSVGSNAYSRPVYHNPPRSWTFGGEQGDYEATVRNNTGGKFYIECASGSTFAGQGATINLTLTGSGRFRQSASNNLDSVIEVDGHPFNLTFEREAGNAGETTYSARAFNVAVTGQFEEIVTAIRRGRILSVYVTPDQVEQQFSLNGAAVALETFEGHLEGC